MHQVTLCLAGDIMTGRGVDQILAHPGNPELHEAWVKDARDYVMLAEHHSGSIPRRVGMDYPWRSLAPLWRRYPARYLIANIETAITRHDCPWPGKGIHYRMHPHNTAVLQELPNLVCSLANNHVMDWQRAGLAETLDSLGRCGIKFAGAGHDMAEAIRPLVLPLKQAGPRLLFLAAGCTSSGIPTDWSAGPRDSGVFLLQDLGDKSIAQVRAAIASEHRPGDLVVVSLHWGMNWGYAIPHAHIDFAHRLIDEAGVHLVHGHSSHHPIGIEHYHGQGTLYGCGDLLNHYEGIEPKGIEPRPDAHPAWRSDLAALYFVTLKEVVQHSTWRLARLMVLPLKLQHFRLAPAHSKDSQWLKQTLARTSETLNSQFSTAGSRAGHRTTSRLAPGPAAGQSY